MGVTLVYTLNHQRPLKKAGPALHLSSPGVHSGGDGNASLRLRFLICVMVEPWGALRKNGDNESKSSWSQGQD